MSNTNTPGNSGNEKNKQQQSVGNMGTNPSQTQSTDKNRPGSQDQNRQNQSGQNQSGQNKDQQKRTSSAQ
jgi:hypothetical protein